MKSLIKRFNAWRYRRHLQRVARWEQTRLKGKVRFVIRVWLIWGGTMIVGSGLLDWYFHGAIDIPKSIYFSLVAPIVALVAWWVNEGEFKAAKIDARAREMQQRAALNNHDV